MANYQIRIVDQFHYSMSVVFGLSVEGPAALFPLVLGSSLRTEQGDVVDLPAKRIVSPGPAIWSIADEIDGRFKTGRASDYSLRADGEIIFALWRDDSFTERFADTGWQRWQAIHLPPGSSTAGLDMQDWQIQTGYASRRDALQPLGRKLD